MRRIFYGREIREDIGMVFEIFRVCVDMDTTSKDYLEVEYYPKGKENERKVFIRSSGNYNFINEDTFFRQCVENYNTRFLKIMFRAI